MRNSNKFSLKKTGINKRKENLTSSLYTINEAQRLAEEQWRSPDPILRTRIEIVLDWGSTLRYCFVFLLLYVITVTGV